MMYRNEKLKKSAKYEKCVSCGIDDGTIVFAHSNEIVHGKGKSLKAHDIFGAYLCNKCHFRLDSGSETKEEKKKLFRDWWEKTLIIAANKGYL